MPITVLFGTWGAGAGVLALSAAHQPMLDTLAEDALIRRITGSVGAGVLAATGTAASGSLAAYGPSGLETPLFALLVLLTVVDLLGLTDEHIARNGKRDPQARDDELARQPDQAPGYPHPLPETPGWLTSAEIRAVAGGDRTGC